MSHYGANEISKRFAMFARILSSESPRFAQDSRLVRDVKYMIIECGSSVVRLAREDTSGTREANPVR